MATKAKSKKTTKARKTKGGMKKAAKKIKK